MLRLSVATLRDRWRLFAGAVVAVALGVGLVQSGLQVLAATDRPDLPPGLSAAERARIRDGYAGAATLLGMSVLLAVFLTVFVVSTTFGFVVVQRRRELALLRLIGAKRAQVRRMLLGEAVLLGLLGTVAGLPLGLLGTWAQSELLIRLGMLPAWFTAPWVSGAAWAAGAVGLSTAVVGVVAAAWRAARLRPLEALADLAPAVRVMTGWRWFWGLSALGVTALMVLAGQASADLLGGLMISLAVMVSGSVAMSQLSPVAVPLVGRLPALLLRGNPVADLARANVLYAVRRSAATAAPLIVLVGLLLGLWGTLGSLAAAVGAEQRKLVAADLVVSTAGPLPWYAGVAVASTQTTVPVTVTRRVAKKKSQTYYSEAVGIDPAAYQRTHPLTPRKGSLDRLAGRTIAIGPGMSAEGFRLGSTVTVAIGDRRLPLKVVAILPETLDVNDNFFVPRSLLPAGAGRTEAFVQAAPGTDVRSLADRIRADGNGTVESLASWADGRGDAQQRGSNAIFAVLMGLAGVYAAVAVVNAVAMAAADRRREFALARMAGLTRGQVVRLALLEAVTVVVIGVALGCVVAAAALAGIAAGTADTLGVTVVAIPWRLLLTIATGSLLVVGAAAAVTAWSATKPAPVSLLGGRE